MRIISVRSLREFMTANPDSAQPLRAWIDEAQKANWSNPADIKDQYLSASILKGSRVVFNIKGNDYRLVAAIAYPQKLMFIKFIGTHREYDAIDANTVEQRK
ncbi:MULTISPECIES: type II toxin-antitoxin system HigB family toxin [Pantoea]|uniref:Toxin RelE n=2 Tax=Pantoea TaxID=53335 RepID=A0A0U3TI02_9GAMM|nr:MULTISPECIES: type II toxin-antitoxin system HigB family toxin [Pantoea]ALV94453.1 toxin RelE [Pantoea vagans]KHJ66918.1 toxin RelE [Pantoea rodasii]